MGRGQKPRKTGVGEAKEGDNFAKDSVVNNLKSKERLHTIRTKKCAVGVTVETTSDPGERPLYE